MSAKVTLKSTKQEILDALHDAEKKLKEQQSIMAAPAAAAEKAEAKKVVETATSDVKSGMFSDEMNEKFENLQKAIKLQEEKLKTSYDVEAALINMTIAINAQKQAKLNLDAELEQARAAARAEMEELRAENQRLADDLALQRKREQAEYEYNLSRSRKQEADAHADNQALLAKKIAEAEAHLADLNADAEAIAELRRQVESMPDMMEARYQEGIAEGQKEAGKEYGYKKAMAEKEQSYELRERDGRIERLEKENEEKSAKIASLEAKLDSAYTQLRDLATKTVESSGGVKVISASGDAGSPRK